MNQIILEVRLYGEEPDKDILAFIFEDGEQKINLNTETCQGEIKEVFSKLLRLCIENDISLDFKVDEGYGSGRGLYIDVCSEYIKELQKELNIVKERLRREFGTNV